MGSIGEMTEDELLGLLRTIVREHIKAWELLDDEARAYLSANSSIGWAVSQLEDYLTWRTAKEKESSAMTQAELARDPKAALQRAQNGPLTITDAKGRPRAILSVPTDERYVPGIDDD